MVRTNRVSYVSVGQGGVDVSLCLVMDFIYKVEVVCGLHSRRYQFPAFRVGKTQKEKVNEPIPLDHQHHNIMAYHVTIDRGNQRRTKKVR